MPESSNGKEEALIVFTPSGKRGSFPIGTKVLDAARHLGVDIDSVCGGRGICGRCQVQPSLGDFPKFNVKSHADHISEFGAKELRYKEKRGMKDGRRLSCSAVIEGDLVIDVPADSQVHKQVVRKRAEVRNIEIDPVVRLHYVEVEEPDMHHPSGDLERVKTALKSQWDIDVTRADLPVLQTLQKALRDGEWKITAAVRYDGELIYVWPGFQGNAYGLAVDIGSTTMSVHLTDLQTGEVVSSVGAMNPQIRFGEDLMSRVSYVMMNPGGEQEMTAAVQETLNFLAGQAATEAGVDLTEILELVLVGNPIMHHLALGINPVELGWAPFALATNSAVELWADEINVRVNPGARAYFLPCVAGHVGADAAAVTLAEGPQYREEITLVVDVGTNAEIVLGNKDRLLACSSPTGPALEGAQISSGQRAANGAIERVRIDPETLEPRFKVIGCDLWSDDDGFELASAKVGVTGICGSGIIEVMAEMFLAGIMSADGIIDGSMAEKSDRIVPEGRTFSYIVRRGEPEIRVTQADVRAIQLAKGALYAGAQLLVDKLGKPVERVVLAGAFGSHIDPKYAMVLGLVPDCDLDKVVSVGNAAGTGARIALLNRKARGEVERLVADIEKIETAVEAKFQDHFVGAMAFPHKTAPYPNLQKVVALPARKTAQDGDDSDGTAGGGRRRRRRRG
ncbi:ASKHA domain-containing protein [Aestuariispira ectoiniformans]|uniref:ASKHA domain-containing protein n=1 Tax=Aestuariispira ectoiniformans TaxID=2775080 RepID=UPI00223B63AA|nr:ASKHA domain-containing protein [Aestuariispira ectoiniformans]